MKILTTRSKITTILEMGCVAYVLYFAINEFEDLHYYNSILCAIVAVGIIVISLLANYVSEKLHKGK